MKTIITIIRVAVGWHFLYEGCIKLFAEKWSAASYLNNTFGFLSGFYHWLAASPGRLAAVDFLNVWGLILIGLALFVGLFIRWSSLAGALLLTLYYFAYPPFGISLLGGDGSVYIINQLFIEAAILVFFFCSGEKGYGLYHVVQWVKIKKRRGADCKSAPTLGESAPTSGKSAPTADLDADASEQTGVNTRREALKNMASLPVLGLFGWSAFRSGKLYGMDAMSGATIQINRLALSELKGVLPKGKLGVHEVTRLVMGGNLISGSAHARDLLYAGALFKAYNTERKVFETLMLAEQAGINCISSSFSSLQIMMKYKKLTGSKLKVIIQTSLNEKSADIYENIKKAIDGGMDIIQMHGGQCDSFVRDNKIDLIGKMIDEVRRQGYVAGMAAHTIDSLIICEENGIVPDYYMKTMHHDNYWSAHPRENRQPFEVDNVRSKDHNMFHDNCFCTFPDRTVEFVNRVQVPVIGYKVLAAGAIPPKSGFKWAFENGADFICVGMFDFQLVDDVNICLDTLQNLQNRERRWYG